MEIYKTQLYPEYDYVLTHNPPKTLLSQDDIADLYKSYGLDTFKMFGRVCNRKAPPAQYVNIVIKFLEIVGKQPEIATKTCESEATRIFGSMMCGWNECPVVLIVNSPRNLANTWSIRIAARYLGFEWKRKRINANMENVMNWRRLNYIKNQLKYIDTTNFEPAIKTLTALPFHHAFDAEMLKQVIDSTGIKFLKYDWLPDWWPDTKNHSNALPIEAAHKISEYLASEVAPHIDLEPAI